MTSIPNVRHRVALFALLVILLSACEGGRLPDAAPGEPSPAIPSPADNGQGNGIALGDDYVCPAAGTALQNADIDTALLMDEAELEMW